MKLVAVLISLVHGLCAVGVLAIGQAVVQAFNPAWTLPFSIWWGMVLTLPGLAMAVFFGRIERDHSPLGRDWRK